MMPTRRPPPRRSRSASPARKPAPAPESAAPRPLPRLEPKGYWALSTRPLHILAFLAPLIAAYELGSALYLVSGPEGAHRTIQAQRLLGDFFHLFGVVGLFLPGIALVTVLLVWHVLLRDRWRLELPVLIGMFIESAGWTLPLLVLAAVMGRASMVQIGVPPPHLPPLPLAGGGAGVDLYTLPWQARLTISIGAGLYEEMLFRLVLIAFLHLVLADLARLPGKMAYALCIAGSALTFALYHDTTLATGGTDWMKLGFFAASGAYLATVYVMRGFGIAVGAHAMYDTLVLVLLRQ
ncbi:MAG: CPBP family intramembrane metalloprotease [Phycisphaeraceae bacterium]|nr:CPBP family intramembrane metalloprotease [Phycisphaeraceae bacterium]